MAKKTTKKIFKKKATTKKKYKTRKKKKLDKKITMEIEDVYKYINDSQVNRKSQQLLIDSIDSPMVANILKDLCMPFISQDKGPYVLFKIEPPPENIIDDKMFEFEEVDDEIQDQENCF
jgi:hypothetical protein